MKYHANFRLLINAAGVVDPGSVHFSTIFYAHFDISGSLHDTAWFSGGGDVPTRN